MPGIQYNSVSGLHNKKRLKQSHFLNVLHTVIDFLFRRLSDVSVIRVYFIEIEINDFCFLCFRKTCFVKQSVFLIRQQSHLYPSMTSSIRSL